MKNRRQENRRQWNLGRSLSERRDAKVRVAMWESWLYWERTGLHNNRGHITKEGNCTGAVFRLVCTNIAARWRKAKFVHIGAGIHRIIAQWIGDWTLILGERERTMLAPNLSQGNSSSNSSQRLLHNHASLPIQSTRVTVLKAPPFNAIQMLINFTWFLKTTQLWPRLT